MRNSVNKELQVLEEVLYECKQLPDGLVQGKIVANTIKHFVAKNIED